MVFTRPALFRVARIVGVSPADVIAALDRAAITGRSQTT
jgi:hypothetical protein